MLILPWSIPCPVCYDDQVIERTIIEQMTKQRQELHPNAIIAVGAVVYRWTKRGRCEMLLIKKQIGYWTLPKGRVHIAEARQDAVLREVLEETGVSGQVEGEVLQVSYITPRRRRPRRKIVTYYLVQVESDVVAAPGGNPNEIIEQIRWATPRAALRRVKRQRIRRVIKVAAALLRLRDQNDPVEQS